MATANDMRELGAEELVSRLREAKEELFNLRFQMATGQMGLHRHARTRTGSLHWTRWIH
jgi:large subunit ribosomal protein L29